MKGGSSKSFPLCCSLRLVSEEKYLEDRIVHVERNFSALATGLGGMVRRTARLRDKGDTIVKTLKDFATTESGEMKKSLEGVAECFSAMEDCNHLKVRRSLTSIAIGVGSMGPRTPCILFFP